MLVGYARVSTDDQNPSLQIDARSKQGIPTGATDRLGSLTSWPMTDIGARDTQGGTPLHAAASLDHIDTVRLRLERNGAFAVCVPGLTGVRRRWGAVRGFEP